jgi:hypothetical protein
MKTGMNIAELITEVQRQSASKLDLLADTRELVRMVEMPDFPDRVAMVVATPDSTELQRFAILDNAHRQIATWLDIPWKHYKRMLADHRDLIITEVNTLFEREPGTRMLRTMDGACRAFLSNQYRRIDNDFVLAKTLPELYRPDGTLPPHEILGSHVNEHDMRLRVVWTDPKLEQTIGTTRDGKPDIIKPGFEIGNGETGRKRLFVRGFFYRSFCFNGCIFGVGDNAVEFSRNHVGGKLSTAGVDILSDDTKQKDDAALVAMMTDVMRALGNVEFITHMGDTLRALKDGTQISNPTKAVEVLGKEVGLREHELDDVLKNLIGDQDYSRWGALNAITAVANKDETTQERAFELEEIGASLMTMSMNQWNKIANAERVRVAA